LSGRETNAAGQQVIRAKLGFCSAEVLSFRANPTAWNIANKPIQPRATQADDEGEAPS